jgi:hypothetical protein
MYPANNYVIRPATRTDERALTELAQLDSQRPLTGSVLIGEIDGAPSAAVALADGRVVADPFQHTASLTQVLRMRAGAKRVHSRMPTVRERIRAAMAPFRARVAAEA